MYIQMIEIFVINAGKQALNGKFIQTLIYRIVLADGVERIVHKDAKLF